MKTCITGLIFATITFAQPSGMMPLIERYAADRASLERSYTTPLSPHVRARMRAFYQEWTRTTVDVEFDSLNQDGKIDYILLRNTIAHDMRALDLREKEMAETAPLLPFATAIVDLAEANQRMETVDARAAAAIMDKLDKLLDAKLTATPGKFIANRAARETDQLRLALKAWFDFHNGYDPQFTWWVGESYKSVDRKLTAYAARLREIAGVKPGDNSAIVGNPIGRDALISELNHEMIPYTPEELIAIGEREYAWCEGEMRKVSREMGFGDDWLKAVEKIKTIYVEPGKQPALIRDLALEAIEFVEKRDLVTIPPLARETWRMQMMTPERQIVNPFFTGGESISVSYPTNTMSYEQKMMSMRGNNIPFARATVFHELIPGHELQQFMMNRYRQYRRPFRTPLYGEGWSLYWEMLMWDLHFGRTPEESAGMLFWRMYRAARVLFSLNFHLGKWSVQECIDFLVNRVGHERENAAAEVRRSFAGEYSPLYQAAYLLGGLQLRSLHHDLVDSGKMTNKQFHDAVLKENSIPIEMIRAEFTKQKLTRDFVTSWRFYPLDSPARP